MKFPNPQCYETPTDSYIRAADIGMGVYGSEGKKIGSLAGKDEGDIGITVKTGRAWWKSSIHVPGGHVHGYNSTGRGAGLYLCKTKPDALREYQKVA